MSGIHKPNDFGIYMIGLDDSYLGLGPTAFKNMFQKRSVFITKIVPVLTE